MDHHKFFCASDIGSGCLGPNRFLKSETKSLQQPGMVKSDMKTEGFWSMSSSDELPELDAKGALPMKGFLKDATNLQVRALKIRTHYQIVLYILSK